MSIVSWELNFLGWSVGVPAEFMNIWEEIKEWYTGHSRLLFFVLLLVIVIVIAATAVALCIWSLGSEAMLYMLTQLQGLELLHSICWQRLNWMGDDMLNWIGIGLLRHLLAQHGLKGPQYFCFITLLQQILESSNLFTFLRTSHFVFVIDFEFDCVRHSLQRQRT
jgi:hypothetical protein